MQPLHQIVRQFVLSVPGVKRVLIAFSGGVDSTVLLHCVAKASLPYPLLALHVNHQLSANADDWQRHCAEICVELGVERAQERVQVQADGGGTEEAARRARYQAFERHLRGGDLLLLGHHQQDQCETFFLRLLRGSGARGLGAMAPLRPHGPALLGRPLLNLSKDDLLAYARSHQLTWIEDESNVCDDYDRNYLRAQVVPALEQRWPRALQQVTYAAERLRETDALLTAYAQEDLLLCEPKAERVGHSLSLQPLLDWSAARRIHVVRAWLESHGYRMPAQKQMRELESLVAARPDRSPLINWRDCELRRFQDRLYCLPAHWQQDCESSARSASFDLRLGSAVTFACGSRLEVVEAEEGLRAGGDCTVELRKYCPQLSRAQPSGRAHSQSIKKLLQEFALEPWLRPYVPLVFQSGQLAAVADLWVEKSHLHRGAQAVRLAWHIEPAHGRL